MKFKISLILILLIAFSGSVVAQQLSLKWAQQFGGKGWDYINCMGTTSSNQYFLGGSFKGTFTNDTLHKELENSSNAFIAICDTNGNTVWQKVFGGKMFENVTSLVSTSQGTLISGIFQDTIRFDNQIATTNAFLGAFLALVDENGNATWLKNTGGLATVKQIFLCSTSQGNVYMAGSFSDSLQLAGQQLALTGEKGFFLTSLQPDGSEINPFVFKGTGSCKLGGITCNDSMMCIAGSFSDTLFINDTTLISYGEEDVFIALFTTSGILKRLITAGGIGIEQATSVAFSPAGDIGIIGSFDYSILIENEIIQTNGGKDIFITALDSGGNLKWIRNIGGLGNDYGYTIATNNDNEYFITGNFVHLIQIPDQNGNLVSIDASNAFGNAFIAKYSNTGELKASYNLPATSEDFCKSLIASNDGMITAAGNFYQTVQIPGKNGDTTALVSNGERDIFLIRFLDLCKGVTVDAGADTAFCPGQSIYLTTPSLYPYFRWLPSGLPNQGLNVTLPGTYKLLITDANGCIASDSLHITIRYLPLVLAGNDTIISAGENLQLLQASATNADNVEWSTSGTGFFSNANLLSTTYSPSYDDISKGLVELTLSGTNSCISNSDNLILTIDQDDDGITAFPNPTQGIVTLVCNEGISIQTASITTQMGNVIQANISVNSSVMQYDLSSFPPGTFLFHLVTGTSTVTKIINKL
jgi:hypothetical protein